MLDYEAEADAYDATRGGEPRARAAADAVLGLIPEGAGRLLDVACGTGIVTRRLAAGRPGLRVTGADLTHAMARLAVARLPAAVFRADSRRLPVRDGSFDAVTTVWLLHLLEGPEDVRAVIDECARALRPGGVYITTLAGRPRCGRREPAVRRGGECPGGRARPGLRDTRRVCVLRAPADICGRGSRCLSACRPAGTRAVPSAKPSGAAPAAAGGGGPPPGCRRGCRSG
ncbi:class I SAM-dependent methyltransferase [Streptomyces chiangmaiensis]|uniref:Class I SAM-dependent methyltransferase n=1 Tax=Streptomyces chiangmaiensis TaxID=766497 RepID=A0ABU7FEH4_9ACTN|nr:class I SAM-dependent methyltransferase [Streptomyces chiangmaiensis]MED7821962.1 class I SAM-dependent methyltransferase [Streptomyces chiangmaiensis]